MSKQITALPFLLCGLIAVSAVAQTSMPITGPLAPSRSENLNEGKEAEELKHAEVFSLTISGGVSLGSYQAGQLYLIGEALKRSPGAAQLKVVTGASAGAANALITGTESCRQSTPIPEQSLGYQTWVNVGLDDLFDSSRVTSYSLFVMDALESRFDKLAQTWREGLSEECHFIYGISATRDVPQEVELAPGLSIPRQSERFVVDIKGRGSNKLPIFKNFVAPGRSLKRPLLPLSGRSAKDPTRDFEAIREATLASMAFPVAFAPRPVPHCTTPDHQETKSDPAHFECLVPTRVDPFVDGRVFDNSPLGMAYEAAS